MPVSHTHRFIFVHVPKTAGSSVRRALAAADAAMEFDGRAGEAHKRYIEAVWAEPAAETGEKPRLGTIREGLAAALAERDPQKNAGTNKEESARTVWLHHLPAARLRPLVGESAWSSYFKFAFVRNPWDRMVSFYHFHKARLELPGVREERPQLAGIYDRAETFEDWLRAAIYVAPCSFFLFDRAGKPLVDFIGRFEHLDRDFAAICRRLGIEGRLPHLKRSDHAHYRHYYTDDAAELVARHFKADIAHFGYTFGAD